MTEEQKERRRERLKAYLKVYREVNKDKIKAWEDKTRAKYAVIRAARREDRKIYLEENKERFLAYGIEYRKKNKEKIAAKKAADYRKDPAKHKQVALTYARNNPAVVNARNARRNAAKLNATPLWANMSAVKQVYELAQFKSKETNTEWHVDHIVPLRSPTVCGLHCEANLQVLPGIDNISKNNRHWPDMPEGGLPL